MLHDDFWTQNNKQYLQDRIAHICLKSRSMDHVEMPWPGKDVIDTLVRRACGQFLYAATVPKFVGQKRTQPTRQLKIVLCPHPSRAQAFSELDCLYPQIFWTHPDPDTLVRILSIILAFEFPQHAIVIEEILEIEKGEVSVVLAGLYLLLELPDDGISDIRILHPFRDYLLDRNGSGLFFIHEMLIYLFPILSTNSNWIFIDCHFI
jgi:hypothetical protein